MKSQSTQHQKIMPSKFLKIILIFIWIRSRIILCLAVINICPTVKFIAHAKTLLLQCSVSLFLSLSLQCLPYSLPFSFHIKRHRILRLVSLNKQILLNVVLIYSGSLYETIVLIPNVPSQPNLITTTQGGHLKGYAH